MVGPKQTTESFGALDFSVKLANVLSRIDEHVAEPPMISFDMIVLNVFTNGSFQRPLAKEDYAAEAYGVQRTEILLQLRFKVATLR